MTSTWRILLCAAPLLFSVGCADVDGAADDGTDGESDTGETVDTAADALTSNMFISGRVSMGDMDQNQCGIQYSGAERVGADKLLIAGLDNKHFGTSQNGKLTATCGRIAILHMPNGATQKFVIVDRIWENQHPNGQLDVAKQFYYKSMRNNINSARVELTGQVARGLKCADWTKYQSVSKTYCNK